MVEHSISYFLIGFANLNLIFIVNRQKCIPTKLNIRANVVIKNLIIVTLMISELLY